MVAPSTAYMPSRPKALSRFHSVSIAMLSMVKLSRVSFIMKFWKLSRFRRRRWRGFVSQPLLVMNDSSSLIASFSLSSTFSSFSLLAILKPGPLPPFCGRQNRDTWRWRVMITAFRIGVWSTMARMASKLN